MSGSLIVKGSQETCRPAEAPEVFTVRIRPQIEGSGNPLGCNAAAATTLQTVSHCDRSAMAIEKKKAELWKELGFNSNTHFTGPYPFLFPGHSIRPYFQQAFIQLSNSTTCFPFKANILPNLAAKKPLAKCRKCLIRQHKTEISLWMQQNTKEKYPITHSYAWEWARGSRANPVFVQKKSGTKKPFSVSNIIKRSCGMTQKTHLTVLLV